MASPSDALEAMLVGCLSIDNQVRGQAEEAVKVAAKKPEIVPELVQKIYSSPNPQVRQLSAVLLRKKITSHWRKLSKETQETTKSILLDNIVRESASPVRRATADVVSIIAKHTVPQGEWNHLLEFLYQCSSSQEKEHREVALMLFTSLTETIGDLLRPHFPTLQGIFLRGLQDPVDTVRVAALKAVGALSELIESEEEGVRFRELLQPIAEVAKFCLANGDDDVAMRVFEIFSDLVETSSTVLQPQLPALVQFSLEVAANADNELATREAALQIVHQLAEFKPKQLVKNNLNVHLISSLCNMCAEPVPEDWEETQQLPAQKFASQALDVLSLNLPTKHVFPESMKYVQAAARDADPARRSSAHIITAVLSEGCAEVMRKHLGDLLAMSLGGLKDPHARVRRDAAYCLGQMSNHLMPDIAEHYEKVMPLALDLLLDESRDVRKSGLYAIDQFVEQLEDDQIEPYMEPLMTRLLAILSNSQMAADLDHDTIDMTLSAIASAAAASEDAFEPYAAHVLPILRQYMTITKDEALGCRARATECAALVMSALGKEKAIAAGLEDFSGLVMAGMDLDYPELKEYAYCYFGHVAKLLKAEFAHFLPAVAVKAFESIEQVDGIVGDGPKSNGTPGISIDVSSDEEDEGGAGRWTQVRTGIMDEKASACETLGIFAAVTGQSFMPYMEKALECIESMAGYFVEDVRHVAYRAMRGVVQGTLVAFPPPSEGQSSPQARAIVEKALSMWLTAAAEDEDKVAVAAAMEMAAETIKEVGAVACSAQHIEALAAAANALLKDEANCQRMDSDGEDVEEDEENDADEELLSAACDLLPALAKALGSEAYAPMWAQHFESLTRHTRGGRPEAMRAVAMGCLAEVGEAMQGHMEPYVARIMTQVVKELRASNSGNRRNAAFCAGVMCLYGGQTGARYFMDVLRALHPLFGEEEDSGTKDNAAGALARILLAAGPAVPLDQALPVLLSALPLQEDHSEGIPVFRCLATLATGEQAAAVAPFLPQIVQAFGAAAVDPDTEEEALSIAGKAVTLLHGSCESLVRALPLNQQQALAAAAQG